MNNFLEKRFHIAERGSTISREIIGGLVTFLAMAYILVVNPSILGATGMDYTALVVATALASGIGTLLTALIANAPIGQSTGLGVNAFFAYTLCLKMGYSWQQCLAITFISGLVFLGVMLSPLRNKIIDTIPASLKRAISVGIGLFVTLIAFFNAGIIQTANGILDLGVITSGPGLLAIIGLAITAILMIFRVKGAILIGIIAATLIGIPMGVTNTHISSLASISVAPIFFKLSFTGLLSAGIVPLLTSIFTLAIIDTFDSVGTLTATLAECNMIDENGQVMDKTITKALVADAAATCTGALTGVSTITSFVESSTGIAAGARTGLASIVTSILFFLSCFLAPVAGIVPSAATAAALIIVGVLMFKNVKYIDWTDLEIAIPAFITIVAMPFTYSISNGLGFGIISYVLIKMIRGKFKEINPLMYVLAALFILMFIL
jgi:AGZA family xanthine/uracil permease-like MFS transporter